MHRVGVRRQDLAEQLFEPDLPERPAQPRYLQQLLHVDHRVSHPLETLRHDSELAQAFPDVGESTGLLGGPVRERSRKRLLGAEQRVKPSPELNHLGLEECGVACGSPRDESDEKPDGCSEKRSEHGGHAGAPRAPRGH